MYDPVFDVSLEGAKLLRSRPMTQLAVPRIVVLTDVYPNKEVHRLIPTICDAYMQYGGVNLVCLEGADGPIPWPEQGTTLGNLERQYPGLSTATRNLLLSGQAGDVRMVGVEDLELQVRAQRALEILDEQKGNVRLFIDALRPLLIEAQCCHYPDELSELRRVTLDVYGDKAALARRMELCRVLLSQLAADPDTFPQVATMADALSSESQLDFQRIEAARNSLVGPVLYGIGEVFQRQTEGERYQALARFICDKFGIGPVEMRRNIELRGQHSVNTELDRLLTSWLVKEAIRFQKGEQTDATFYDELVELAETVGVDTKLIADVRAYVDYVHRSQSDIVLEAFTRQEQEIPPFFVRQVKHDGASKLFELEEQLDGFIKGVSHALTADRAESVHFGGDMLRDCLARLQSLAGSSSPEEMLTSSASLLQEALPVARTFYEACLGRSRRMVEKSLQAMTESGSHRMLIVAGGFHSDAIARALDDRGDVAWSMIMPAFSLSKEPEHELNA